MKKSILLLLAFPLIAFSQQQGATINFTEPDYSAYFQEAYQHHPAIPRGVLEAVAYTNTHMYHVTHNAGDAQNCMGMPLAYGVMGLTLDGKNYFNNNLVYVSNLSGIASEEIINNPEKNILAYASAFEAVMNSVKANNSDFTKILANSFISLSELPHQDAGQIFALNSQLYSYFDFLNNPEFQLKYNFTNYHFDLKTFFGENNYKVLSASSITVSDENVSDNAGHQYKSVSPSGINTMSSDYAPAIFNPAGTCNYSSRTQAVTAIVIHDIEGSYASCISWFKNCSANVSAHYVVRSSDGQITQMVLESKKAWHVGSENGYTIGIEHEGYQAQTGWYTTAMYTASANLVKDICTSGYGIIPTTCYNGPSCNGICLKASTIRIKGHQMYPNQSHNDPGPNWNWGTYYNLINNTSSSCGTPSGLSASIITSNSTTLNWTAVAGANSYNVQYKPSSSSTWTSTTSSTNSKPLSGLAASTSYDFKVQAFCSVAGTYSSTATFTTTASGGSNDDCANALIITPNSTCIATAGNLLGATAGGLAKASCDVFSTPALKDVWFQFQATASSSTIKITPSAGLDAVLALYSSCSGGAVGCSDNGGGPGGIETINATSLTIGNTYYIRVYSYGATLPSTTTFNICVTAASTTSCGTPTGLSATSISSSGATLNWAAVAGATSYNIQYKPGSSSTWTSTTSSTASKSITGLSASTSFDFKVQAVCTSTGSFSSVATFTTLTLSGSNDDCANAQTISPNATCISTTGNVAGATAGGLAKASCDGYSGTAALRDVWFKFQATAAAHNITVAPSSSFDAVLAMYTSCTGGQIGCSDNGGGQGASETITATALTVGNTYYLRVYSYGSSVPATTTFNICVTTPGTNPTVNCDISLKTTIETFKVYKHNPSGAILFKAKMAIDADGSPRAYGPGNTGLDYTANAGSSGNWWGVVTDSYGNPVIQGSGDPYPGMYVSTTSLVNSSYGTTNPLRYTNSEAVPFFVLPSAVTALGNISLGDIAYVYNTSNGMGCYAVFADGGPAGKLGEGSIYLANQLGINSNPRTGGTASGIIDYIVFPQSGAGQGTIPSISQINSIGTAKITSVGGTGITTCIPPSPPLIAGINEASVENTESALEVFPNPFDGSILYGKFLTTDSKNIIITLYDMVGREVFAKEVIVEDGSFSISFDKVLKPGIYLMVGNDNSNRFTKRVVVK